MSGFKTFFVRHSSKLDIDSTTLNMLWDDNYIGVHYPSNVHGKLEADDNESTNLNDYSGTGKTALKKLTQICTEGGYVCAVYKNKSGAKVGFVPKGSTIEVINGKWGKKSHREGRDAKLKGIKLTNVQVLTATESIVLKSTQPRQGTICHWPKAGIQVQTRVDKLPIPREVKSLTPDQQEVMCMEYLRTDKASARGLPKLTHTLMPVGRTLKDVDIVGRSGSGNGIYVQVTLTGKKSKIGIKKFNKLKAYATSSDYAIYFSASSELDITNTLISFPIKTVFDDFCIQDAQGKMWFDMVTKV
ncbi:hypothetical protein GCM10007916_01610 [Psychromonas marina]|uniref:Uncharacterized protein n=1 Tax=Psychromonas marina TaxID=88364 RepID=A0ABQ6DVL9_9GAMM|nr:hypothetical protein [Psychromonas marina]GLS89094.1 hypothetical protein GCM10007916_01610 [Psychromonas marina]